MTPPPGYVAERVGGTELVAVRALVPTLREALREGTLYEYAAHHRDARLLRGRGPVYAVPLPDGETRVVVRRSRHGGVLAGLTGERFLAPTRAPRELRTALRLQRLGVPTAEVLAYALYPAGPLLRRADVVTREVPDARDLPEWVRESEDEVGRREGWSATWELLRRLADGGVHHPDLNLKNVLVRRDENGVAEALLLDVDRVRFGAPGDGRLALANWKRLMRSARKMNKRDGFPFDPMDAHSLAWENLPGARPGGAT